MLTAETPRGLTLLCFVPPGEENKAWREITLVWPHADVIRDDARAASLAATVFAPHETDNRTVTLHLKGSPFQLKVWRALLTIPRGETVTYGELALRIGRPGAARAVGTAVSLNPVAVLVPCHRVIRASGETGEYRWGTELKKRLLFAENQ